MARVLLPALATCSLVLAGILYLELASGEPAASSAASDQPPKAATAAAGAQIPAGEDDDTDVKNILARPLFTPGRKPPPRAVVANADTGDQTAFDGRLVGILVTPSEKEALLFDDIKNVSSAVREGESFGGWTLEEISPANVTFRDGERTVTIELLTDKAQNSDDGEGPAPKKPLGNKPLKPKSKDRAAKQAKNQPAEQSADPEGEPQPQRKHTPPLNRGGPRRNQTLDENKEPQPMNGPLIGRGLPRLMQPGVKRP